MTTLKDMHEMYIACKTQSITLQDFERFILDTRKRALVPIEEPPLILNEAEYNWYKEREMLREKKSEGELDFMSLEEIERLCAEASPGPWELARILKILDHFDQSDNLDDAKFIAASRELLPWACKQLRAYQEIEDCLRHAVALGYFNPNGSTEGWAKRGLQALDKLEKK